MTGWQVTSYYEKGDVVEFPINTKFYYRKIIDYNPAHRGQIYNPDHRDAVSYTHLKLLLKNVKGKYAQDAGISRN